MDNNPESTTKLEYKSASTKSSVRNTNVNALCDTPPIKTKKSFIKNILPTVPENYGGRLDFLSKYLFPFSYLVFNISYWYIYVFGNDQNHHWEKCME